MDLINRSVVKLGKLKAAVWHMPNYAYSGLDTYNPMDWYDNQSDIKHLQLQSRHNKVTLSRF